MKNVMPDQFSVKLYLTSTSQNTRSLDGHQMKNSSIVKTPGHLEEHWMMDYPCLLNCKIHIKRTC